MKLNKVFCPIIINLKNKNGHVYNYHIFIKDICLKNNIHYKPVVFNQTKNLIQFSKNQINIYNSFLDYSLNNLLKILFKFKVIKIFKDINYLFNSLKNLVSKENKKKIYFFMESFNIINLFIFYKFFLKNNNNININVLLLIRTHPKNGNYINKINYYLISRLIKKFLKRKNKSKIILITDTTILKKELSILYHSKLFYLPVPSNYICNTQKIIRKKLNSQKIIFPGEARKDKSIKSIIYLCNHISHKKYISIDLKKFIKNKKGFIFFKKSLNFEQYYELFSETNISILTLLPKYYKYSSSGTFIDSIINYTIPLVFENTSMADILRSYNLNELIMNKDNDFILFINKYFNYSYFYKQINIKFYIMHKEIKYFHSKKNFEKKFLDFIR